MSVASGVTLPVTGSLPGLGGVVGGGAGVHPQASNLKAGLSEVMVPVTVAVPSPQPQVRFGGGPKFNLGFAPPGAAPG